MSVKTVFTALADQVRRICGLTNKMSVAAMTDALSKVELGADIDDADAEASDVLSGKKFVGKNGYVEDGAMPDNGNVTEVLDNSTRSVSIAAGYHGGGGIVSVRTQTKSVVPSDSDTEVTPDSGYLLEKVTVGAATGSAVYTGTVVAEDPNYYYLYSLTVDTGVEVSENDTFMIMAAAPYRVNRDLPGNESRDSNDYLTTAIRRSPDEYIETAASTVDTDQTETDGIRDTWLVSSNGDNGGSPRPIGQKITYSGTSVTITPWAGVFAPIPYVWYLIK
jgi:hypothetical protein